MNKFYCVSVLTLALCSCEEPPSATNEGKSPQVASTIISPNPIDDLDPALLDDFDPELLSAMRNLYEVGLDASLTKQIVKKKKQMRVIGSTDPKHWKLVSVPGLYDANGTKIAACIVERKSKLNSPNPAPHLDIWYKAASGTWMYKPEENECSEFWPIFATGYVEEEVNFSAKGIESKVNVKVPSFELRTNIGNGIYFWSQVSAEDSEPKSGITEWRLLSGKTPPSWADPPSGCKWITAPITYRHSRERKIVEDNARERKWTATNKIVWRRYYINKSIDAKQ